MKVPCFNFIGFPNLTRTEFTNIWIAVLKALVKSALPAQSHVNLTILTVFIYWLYWLYLLYWLYWLYWLYACIDCIDCIGCIGCIGCINCIDCIDFSDCINSIDYIYCSDCVERLSLIFFCVWRRRRNFHLKSHALQGAWLKMIYFDIFSFFLIISLKPLDCLCCPLILFEHVKGLKAPYYWWMNGWTNYMFSKVLITLIFYIFDCLIGVQYAVKYRYGTYYWEA